MPAYHDEPVREAAEAMPPPNMELEQELGVRAEQAGSQATELESRAQQWRAVERACIAGLTALREPGHG